MKTKLPTEKTIYMDLPAVLDKYGTNVYRLSKQSGITRATLHGIKSGRVTPSLGTLSAIATALNVTHVELLRTVEK